MQPSLTIVAVTGHDRYTQGSVYAIARSYQQLRTRITDLHCLLVSPTRPEYLPDYIEHYAVQPFSYLEYNLFVLYALADVIHTDYCLTVQNDGWVLNADVWRDEFFAYDFIGAPMTLQLMSVRHHQICKIIPPHLLDQCQLDTDEKVYRPQNGGFSLRSKKLLTAPRTFNIRTEILPPKPLAGQPAKMEWRDNVHHEDVVLSVQCREFLEARGLRFAPDDLAAEFSAEDPYCNQRWGKNNRLVFGTHTCGYFVLTGEKQVSLSRAMPLTDVEIIRLPIAQALIQQGFEIVVPQQYCKQVNTGWHMAKVAQTPSTEPITYDHVMQWVKK